MEFKIRPATLDDVPHLVHHRRAMFEDMKQGTPAELNAADEKAHEYFVAALGDGSYKGWLAEEVSEAMPKNESANGESANGEVARREVVAGGGLVIVPWAGYPGEKHAARVWIVNMYTEPRARRRGLAKKFVNIITEWCRNEGFASVSLHASDAGRLVYQGLGFLPSNEMKLSLR
ncbi:MAG TPA: GNAT family N-acetyltransferase [Candidatus Acidoferrales bacterium]